MGFGSSPFGTSPWGADPVVAPSTRIVAPPVGAMKFDGATRTFVQNVDGTMAGIHPVDQEVALALSLEEGAVGSTKGLGHHVRRIKRSVGPTVIADVTDAVKFALRRPLSRKDIVILSIDVDNTRVRGRIVIAVQYVNLRTLPPGQDPAKAGQQIVRTA